VLSESNTASGDRYGWTGRERDGDTGLQYNRGRYYDAATGRWVDEDPIRFRAGDSNLYRYVRNDPTNALDPLGTDLIFLLNTDWPAQSVVAGHGALLIGPGKYGEYWYLSLGVGQDIWTPTDNLEEKYFPNIDEAREWLITQKYRKWIRFKSNRAADRAAAIA